VPRDPVLEKVGQPIGPVLYVAPPLHTLPPGFRLQPKKSTARDARGRQVDALLDELGIDESSASLVRLTHSPE
jgi:hypothetical protein